MPPKPDRSCSPVEETGAAASIGTEPKPNAAVLAFQINQLGWNVTIALVLYPNGN